MIEILTDPHYWYGFGDCLVLIILLAYIAISFSSEGANVKTREFLLDFQLKKRKKFAEQLKKESDEHCEGK